MIEQKALVIGNGGREHAIAWKLAQDINTVFIAPGNAGTEQVGENVPIDTTDIDRLLGFAKDNKIGLTIVGPEAPLEAGIVDAFTKEGLPIFGPTQEAARLETDKAFAIAFMKRNDIPHPQSRIFSSAESARRFLEYPSWDKFVIKASGLAAGKGVYLPDTLEEANKAVNDILVEHRYNPNDKLIIQERLEGEEISLLAISDGISSIPLLASQDHKRAFDGDKGPNTGGMGAYAPAINMTESLLQEACDTILEPTIWATRKERTPFKGVLYAGLMLTKDGPKVLEYNVRFGDPETQPLMMLLQTDLAIICKASINQTLTEDDVKFRKGSAVSVVLASDGYPGSYKKGQVIHGLETVSNPNVQVFHAGTTKKDGQIVTSGGRALGITAYGLDTLEALKTAYGAIGEDGIHFEGMHYRKDIASKADY